jgi:hypothetical protein
VFLFFSTAALSEIMSVTISPGKYDKFLYNIDYSPTYHVELGQNTLPGTIVYVCLNLNDTVKRDKKDKPTWKLSAIVVLEKGQTESANISPTRRFRFTPNRTTMAQLKIIAYKKNEKPAVVILPSIF